MGCDIHLHIEIKINNQWHHYAAPNISRWYSMFGAMAGVRDNSQPLIVSPKGIPEDITLITKLSYENWGVDAHTPSWFNVEEIDKLVEWLEDIVEDRELSRLDTNLEHGILHCYLFGNSFTGWKNYPGENFYGIQDLRFVFWFDN